MFVSWVPFPCQFLGSSFLKICETCGLPFQHKTPKGANSTKNTNFQGNIPVHDLFNNKTWSMSSVGVCTVPAVPTQGAIPEEGGYKKKKKKTIRKILN